MPLTCGPTATAELLGVRGRYTSIFARDVDTDSSFELLEWIICYSIDHNKIPRVISQQSTTHCATVIVLMLKWSCLYVELLLCFVLIQNKVVMVAGIVAFTSAVAYLAYYRAVVMNQPNSYMAMTEQGELEKRTRTSRWDWILYRFTSHH